jgi:hypothetical protein
VEQTRIPGFDRLSWADRRVSVERERNTYLLRLPQQQQRKTYQQAKKNFKHTAAYVHLNFDERRNLTRKVADCVAGWTFARLFAECIDKIHFAPARTQRTTDEQAFEQVVARFEQFLNNTRGSQEDNFGLLVHDNNPTVAAKHTRLMRAFHSAGTLWTDIRWIIETPLFVESSLTRMVQVADLCGFALRRYLENREVDLFQRIFARADRIAGTAVGVRHFTRPNCDCMICAAHRR